MIEQYYKNNSKIKLMLYLTIVIALIMVVYIIYQFFAFYQQLKKTNDKTNIEAYIDKGSLEKVQSILDSRK